MSLPRLCIARPVAVAMLFLAIALLGAISFGRLPVDLLPDVAYPRLVVHTLLPGAAPVEVERFVSEPIERVVSGVPGVQEVESASRDGVSLVTLRFAWGTDMDFAALGAREKLDALAGALPEMASRPAVLRLDPRSEPVMALTVTGEAQLPELAEITEQVLKRRLEQIDGVAQAAVTGGVEREIQVEVDPARLEALGLSIDEVAAALGAANVSAPGGTIRRDRYRYALRVLGEFQAVEEVSRTPLGAAGMLLGDVATVTDGFREREQLSRYGGAEAVGMLVYKSAGANTVRVAEGVERTLAELREQYPAVRVAVAMSQARFVSDAISNVVENLVEGAVLAFLVLLLFLRDVRYPLAITVAIPISVIATFALLDAFGVSLNLMSLGGLALGVGMLVDNSIVVLENTFRHRELGAEGAEAAARGAEEVQGAITASTLTTIAVFGPIVYIEGVAGELFGALSLAVAFSLLASLFVALTLLPMLAARWDGAAPRRRSRGWGVLEGFDRVFERFAAGYERLLARALERRGRVVGGAALLLLLCVAIGARLERRALPAVDQGEFRVRIDLPRGTPLPETEAVARRAEEILLADPAVEALFSHVGRQGAVAGMEAEGSGTNTARLEVRLRDGERAADALARLRPAFAGLPIAVESGEATAIGRLLGGGEADLAVRIRGDDLEAALEHGRNIEARLAALGSLANVRLGTELGQPEMRVEIDRERAARYGIDPQRVAETIRASMYGRIATEFADFDRKVPVVVRLPEAERHSVETLGELRADGVPLRELIRVRPSVGPSELARVGQGRVVSVYADVAAGSLDGAVEAAQTALRDLPPAPGLRTEIGGENEELRRSFRDLAFAFGLALLLVYMILAAQFESLVHPFIVLLSVPLGGVGAVLALWISGAGLNTMSLIGMIVMAGLVVNNAVIMLDFIGRMRAEGLPVRSAILAAGRVRLRPILMTTLTTLLGLLPMAVLTGPGAELRMPLAIAIFGGLFSATFLTLILVPVVYDLVETGRALRPEGGSAEREGAAAEAPLPAPALAGPE